MRTGKRIFALAFALVTGCAAFAPVSAFANSAPKHWFGTDALGAVVKDENCPVGVEHESLTFDLQEFPSKYYESDEEFAAYTGKVTAEYTFFNPASYDVDMTLVFPFGLLPSYAGFPSDKENDPAEKYKITADGAEVEKKIRYTYSPSAEYDFDLKSDLAKLQDGFVQDDFFRADLPVHEYVFTIEGEGEFVACLTLTGNPSETCVIAESSYYSQKDRATIGMHVRGGGEYSALVFGTPIDFSQWKFYRDFNLDEEVAASVRPQKLEQTTFADFAVKNDPFGNADASASVDWYNALVCALRESRASYASCYGGDVKFSRIERDLLRWYEYTLKIPSGKTVRNAVAAPVYPSIDSKYSPAVFTYTYLLSPAKSWAFFRSIEIKINTPFVLQDAKKSGFEKTDYGYVKRSDGLPYGELNFALSTSASPKPVRDWGYFFVTGLLFGIPVLFMLVVGATFGVVLYRRNKCKKKGRGTDGGARKGE